MCIAPPERGGVNTATVLEESRQNSSRPNSCLGVVEKRVSPATGKKNVITLKQQQEPSGVLSCGVAQQKGSVHNLCFDKWHRPRRMEQAEQIEQAKTYAATRANGKPFREATDRNWQPSESRASGSCAAKGLLLCHLCFYKQRPHQ